MAWRKFHRASGSTGYEHKLIGCTLLVYPRDWVNPKGPATYTASCYGQQKRGEARTLHAAKSAAAAAARRLRAKLR